MRFGQQGRRALKLDERLCRQARVTGGSVHWYLEDMDTDQAARGLSGVALVTSDARPGLVAAIGATLSAAAWRRCGTHYAANLMSVTSPPLTPLSPNMIASHIQSSNPQKRPNREVRHRTDVVGIFPRPSFHHPPRRLCWPNNATNGSKARRYFSLDALTRARAMLTCTDEPSGRQTDTTPTLTAKIATRRVTRSTDLLQATPLIGLTRVGSGVGRHRVTPR